MLFRRASRSCYQITLARLSASSWPFFVCRLSRYYLEYQIMPSKKRAIRLLLEPWIEAAIVDIAKKEGRSLASAAIRMIEFGIAQRRSATTEVSKIVQVIRGEASNFGATS